MVAENSISRVGVESLETCFPAAWTNVQEALTAQTTGYLTQSLMLQALRLLDEEAPTTLQKSQVVAVA